MQYIQCHAAGFFCHTYMYYISLAWWRVVNGTIYVHVHVCLSPCQATFPKAHGDLIFEILTKPNKQMKTPLQLAIENGNLR